MQLFMASHLTQRAGIFYFRARIPTHLIAAYGRAMVSISLGTRDPKEAKVRARKRREELDRALESLEHSGPKPDAEYRGTVLHLSDTDIDNICERYRVMRLANDELQRIQGMSVTSHELDIDVLETVLPDMKRAYARGDLSEVYGQVSSYLKELGLNLARSSPSFERLARRFQQADIEVWDAILQRRGGATVALPLAATDTLTLDEVFKGWKRQNGSNPKTVRSFEQAFEEFKKHTLAPTATMVRKADVVAYRNAVLDRGDTSPATLKKRLGFLRAAFQTAVNDDKLPSNPFAGVKVVVNKLAGTEKPRLPFSMDELTKIFSGPVYQEGFKPRDSLGKACYWLPLLGLYSGARLEEMGQLEVSDIEFHPEHGPYICIRRAVDRSKRTKNLNSVRNFPVHPKLVELGFLDFVASAKRGRLFPALRADKYGVLTTSFSTWFGRYLDRLDIKDSTRVFHSFRHTFIERGKEKSTVVPTEVREAIVGHLSAEKIEKIYGSKLFPLEVAPQI